MIKHNLSVAVIICTLAERSKKLERCIGSILKNRPLPQELFVMQHTSGTIHVPSSVVIVKTATPSLSAKQNIALGLAKSDIVVFTDDDCIVSKTWIRSIRNVFMKNSTIDALFGPVKPYVSSRLSGQLCPSVFDKRTTHIFHAPRIHEHIGFGNNMAFRKKSLLAAGGFKTWLGSGTAARSAGDAEAVIRLLGNGYAMMYTHVGNGVWHDRWLSPSDYLRHELDYLLGDTICYTYFAFTYPFALGRIYTRWKTNVWRYAHLVNMALQGKRLAGQDSFPYALRETFILGKGVVMGAFWRCVAA